MNRNCHNTKTIRYFARWDALGLASSPEGRKGQCVRRIEIQFFFRSDNEAPIRFGAGLGPSGRQKVDELETDGGSRVIGNLYMFSNPRVTKELNYWNMRLSRRSRSVCAWFSHPKLWAKLFVPRFWSGTMRWDLNAAGLALFFSLF